MKLVRLFALLLFIVAVGHGQEIPQGVRYKKATDEINMLAKTGLESALVTSGDVAPQDLFGDVMVGGPMLWKALKPRAEQVMLSGKPVLMVISGKSPITAEGRVIKSPEEKTAFWKQLKKEYAGLSKATVRKAKADEISYFWATIPFDIEEPFLVIDTGSERFIVNFQVVNGKPRLFWIDIVGDLEKLRP